MTALPPRLEAFLGANARQLIAALDDAVARARMIEALEVCAVTLVAIDAIDLDRFELFDLDLPDLSVWNEAAPQVARALRALHEAVGHLDRLFPAPPAEEAMSEDLAFDLIDEACQDEAPVRAGPTIDRWVESEEPVERAVSALVAMLREDVQAVARKLRLTSVVSSRFALLGELQEFRARSVQCLEAVAAAVLKPLGPHHLTALLPRYSTELDRSLVLREELALLAADVSAENERLARSAVGEGPALVQRVTARLESFAAHTCSRQLWARDKRELIETRLFLRAWDPAAGGLFALRRAMEGFTRFLELLVESVSRRPEIEAYDRENAELADFLVP